jgi:hypothetical protein
MRQCIPQQRPEGAVRQAPARRPVIPCCRNSMCGKRTLPIRSQANQDEGPPLRLGGTAHRGAGKAKWSRDDECRGRGQFRLKKRVSLFAAAWYRSRAAGQPGCQGAAAAFHRKSNQAPHRARRHGSTPSGAERRSPRREPPRGALLGSGPTDEWNTPPWRSRPEQLRMGLWLSVVFEHLPHARFQCTDGTFLDSTVAE